MASIARKMKRNKIGKVSQNDIMNAANQVAEEKADKKAKDTIKMYLYDLSMAIESVFVEEYGYRKKRMNRLVKQLNKRLPDHSQFEVEFEFKERPKVKKEQLYDVIELLLDLNCTEKCKIKNHKNCKIYQALNRRNIPVYDEKAKGCPYKVLPLEGKVEFTKEQLIFLQNTLNDTYKRKAGDKNG